MMAPHRTWLMRGRVLLIGHNFRRTLARAFCVTLAAFTLFGTLFRPIWTDGISMVPTIKDRALRFANLLTYRLRSPRRGEIVVIRGAGGRLLYLKRILALPGETVAFDGGQLLIDDLPVPEAYVRLPGNWNMPPRRLEAGAFFVAGDNRATLLSDHVAGVVRRPNLAGVLW